MKRGAECRDGVEERRSYKIRKEQRRGETLDGSIASNRAKNIVNVILNRIRQKRRDAVLESVKNFDDKNSRRYQ